MTHRLPEQVLPHRAPFLFVDQICQVADGAALATWGVRGDEDWLRGHFPSDAIVPGVLIGEALAQTAGIALTSLPSNSNAICRPGFLAHINLKFHASARPPCTIELSAKHGITTPIKCGCSLSIAAIGLRGAGLSRSGHHHRGVTVTPAQRRGSNS